MDETSIFSTSLTMLLFVSLLDDTLWEVPSLEFWLVFLHQIMMLSMFSYAYPQLCIYPKEECLFRSLTQFSTGPFAFSLLSCYGSLYIVDTRPISDIKPTNITAHAVGFLFTFWILSLILEHIDIHLCFFFLRVLWFLLLRFDLYISCEVGSNFILFHVDVQLSQNQCIVLASFLTISEL